MHDTVSDALETERLAWHPQVVMSIHFLAEEGVAAVDGLEIA